MVGRGDQQRFEAVHRGIAEVGRDIQHRADRQVHRIRAQQVGAVGGDRVVQGQAHFRVLAPEVLHDLGQQVEDGGTVGGDVEFAHVQAADLLPEDRIQPVDPLDQRLRQLIEHLAFRAGRQPAADALEQGDAQLPLECLQLQGDGRLADEQGLGRPRHRPQPHRLAERPQGLEPVGFVGKSRGWDTRVGHFSINYKQSLFNALTKLLCQIFGCGAA